MQPVPERSVPQYPIESVDRTLQLVEMLGAQPEVKLTEVRDHLGVGQSTAHRLMAMLVYRGFAVQNPRSRAYSAGPTLLGLGRPSMGERDLVRHAHNALVWLAAQSGETAHFGVLAGIEVRYLDVVESTATLRVTGRVGQRGPAHATSLGKAMLATLSDDDVRDRFADLSLPAITPRTLTRSSQLMAEIARTRSRGWARNREENQVGVCSVGIAVVHPDRGLLGGLSVAEPKARFGSAIEREHAGLLRVAGARFVGMFP